MNIMKEVPVRDKYGKISLCYMPKTFSWLEGIKYNLNICLELAPSFLKMYNITMFRFLYSKNTKLNTPKNWAFFQCYAVSF